MFDVFQNTTRPKRDLFFRKNDANDARLGEIVSAEIADYANAEVVILGCPQDEGVARNQGRRGAVRAPEAIRAQFYKLTNFGISAKIFDLGDCRIQNDLEATHGLHTQIVERVLRDGKRLIVLGGGNDVSFADGAAMANAYEKDEWFAVNIDAHFDVRLDAPRNSGTPYRQLLDGEFLNPKNFYEIAYQPQAASPVYFEYLQNLGANLVSLEEFQSGKFAFQNLIKERLSANASKGLFFGFDVDAVRAADAPGTSAPSPIGLTAEDFVKLAGFAGTLAQTRIVEFTEVNPNFDIDNRTAKLVAVAMHRFLSNLK